MLAGLLPVFPEPEVAGNGLYFFTGMGFMRFYVWTSGWELRVFVLVSCLSRREDPEPKG